MFPQSQHNKMKKMIFAATAALAVTSCGGTDNGLKEKVE